MWSRLVAGGLIVSLLAACGGGDRENANQAPQRPSTPEAHQAITGIVRSQLEALAARDFEKARSFAAAQLRKQFSTESFAIMIERGYPALVRGREPVFGDVTDNGASAFANIRVTDVDGSRVWFRYALLNESGRWRIAGVVPIESPVMQL